MMQIPDFNKLPKKIALIFAIVVSPFMLSSCQTPSSSSTNRISPELLRKSLVNGQTRQEEIYDWLGPPKQRRTIDENEVWTYEWVEQEQGSVYAGTRIGEERAILEVTPNPGFTYLVTKKTLLTLIYSADGVLNNYQILRQ